MDVLDSFFLSIYNDAISYTRPIHIHNREQNEEDGEREMTDRSREVWSQKLINIHERKRMGAPILVHGSVVRSNSTAQPYLLELASAFIVPPSLVVIRLKTFRILHRK